jgi:hypothetical protein
LEPRVVENPVVVPLEVSNAVPDDVLITAVTRRDIFDFLQAEAVPWWGRLSETGFL